jgi:cytochrome o ubiquinol oxidase operon protein cyoD
MTGKADPKRSELITYVTGYGGALLLTCAAFGIVQWRMLSAQWMLGVVFGLALVQMLVHFRFFLHVSLKRSVREDLQLVLFSTLIILLMVGGTLVILFNLRMRMM